MAAPNYDEADNQAYSFDAILPHRDDLVPPFFDCLLFFVLEIVLVRSQPRTNY
jgi:hypothetical protein